jgi:hypothetical protein
MNKRPLRFLTILMSFSSIALIAASCAQGTTNPSAAAGANSSTQQPFQQQGGSGATNNPQNTGAGTSSSCGNGVIDANEQCDLTNLGETPTCELLGYAGGGQLACAANCTYDTNMCSSESAEPDSESTGGGTYGDV